MHGSMVEVSIKGNCVDVLLSDGLLFLAVGGGILVLLRRVVTEHASLLTILALLVSKVQNVLLAVPENSKAVLVPVFVDIMSED